MAALRRISLDKHTKIGIFVSVLVLCVGVGVFSILRTKAISVSFTFPSSRDKYQWPLSRYSAANMPIGANAQYEAANINAGRYQRVTADQDIIYYNPNAPIQDVYYNGASWNQQSSRCPAQGGVQYRAKIPADFYIPGNAVDGGQHGGSPNHSSSLLDENNKVVEWQPLTHCPGQPFVNQFPWDNGPLGRYDLNADYFYGSHGGSGVSGAGLAIKVGEFMPGKPPFHALGLELFAKWDYSCSGGCKRWPASAEDNYANGGYTGSNPKIKPGTLLALRKGQGDSLNLKSEPGKMLAWVMERYGAYIVDDAGWEVIQIPVEFSPDGDFEAQFKQTWGFDFAGPLSNDWQRDVQTILGALNIVDNNEPNSRGGGGNPLMCYAPPFQDGTPDALTSNPNGAVTEPANCNDPDGGGTPNPTPTNAPTTQPTAQPTANPTPTGGIDQYDIVNDNIINIQDLAVLIRDYPRPGQAVVTNSPADFDKNGRVDVSDLSKLVSNWGKRTI